MTRWIQDAGHGGNDGGAAANGLVEKVLTLEAATYVNQRLKELGVNTTVTRSGDVNLSSARRTDLVKKYDKCISHHFNAGGGEGAEFIHSIYADGKFEEILLDEFKKSGYPVRPNPIYTRKYSNRKNLDYYYMHRDTGKCRVTIVEYDFLDGKNASKLKSKSYREGMYDCVVRAICREEGISYKKNSSAVTTGTTFYRVVTGSFKDKKNAEKRLEELKRKGFDSFIDVYKK